MERDQWEHFRRAGELPLIHKRSITSSVGVVAAFALCAWIVFQPPGIHRVGAEAPVHVTLPTVVIVGRRASIESFATAKNVSDPAAKAVVAEQSQP
jgi:hypothetical protein